MVRASDIEIERDVIRRIVMFLLSFACMADEADRRSAVVRIPLVWILSFAERVVLRLTDNPAAAFRIRHTTQADRLAKSFRRLALILMGALRRVHRVSVDAGAAFGARIQQIGQGTWVPTRRPGPSVGTPVFPDTS